MNEVRLGHGCTTTFFNNSKIALVVGGNGLDLDTKLNTMEMYVPWKDEWTLHSTRLPLSLCCLQVVKSHSLNYLMYVIGGRTELDSQKAVYGLTKSMKWELATNLTQKRFDHVSLNIGRKDAPDCK